MNVFDLILENRSIRQVQLVLEIGFDINSRNSLTETVFMVCIRAVEDPTRRLALLKTFLKFKPDINLQDARGKTAFIQACNYGQEDTLNLLLQQPGINVNQSDDDGYTGFMYACESGNQRLVKMLVDAHIKRQICLDLDKANDDGKTAFQMARENNHPGLISIFNSVNPHKNYTKPVLCAPECQDDSPVEKVSAANKKSSFNARKTQRHNEESNIISTEANTHRTNGLVKTRPKSKTGLRRPKSRARHSEPSEKTPREPSEKTPREPIEKRPSEPSKRRPSERPGGPTKRLNNEANKTRSSEPGKTTNNEQRKTRSDEQSKTKHGETNGTKSKQRLSLSAIRRALREAYMSDEEEEIENNKEEHGMGGLVDVVRECATDIRQIYHNQAISENKARLEMKKAQIENQREKKADDFGPMGKRGRRGHAGDWQDHGMNIHHRPRRVDIRDPPIRIVRPPAFEHVSESAIHIEGLQFGDSKTVGGRKIILSDTSNYDKTKAIKPSTSQGYDDTSYRRVRNMPEASRLPISITGKHNNARKLPNRQIWSSMEPNQFDIEPAPWIKQQNRNAWPREKSSYDIDPAPWSVSGPSKLPPVREGFQPRRPRRSSIRNVDGDMFSIM